MREKHRPQAGPHFAITTPSVSSNTMIYQLVLPLRLEGGACERSIARKADHVSRCTTPSVSSSNTMVWQPVDQGEHMSANRAGIQNRQNAGHEFARRQQRAQ